MKNRIYKIKEFRNLFGLIPTLEVKAFMKLALELYPKEIAISEIVLLVERNIVFERLIFSLARYSIGEQTVSERN